MSNQALEEAALVGELRCLSALEAGWYANVGARTGARCCAAMKRAADALEALLAQSRADKEALAVAVEALERIIQLEPMKLEFPDDWSAQIEACPDCRDYRDHPLMRGICNRHREPIRDREKHAARQPSIMWAGTRLIAREALDALARLRPDREEGKAP